MESILASCDGTAGRIPLLESSKWNASFRCTPRPVSLEEDALSKCWDAWRSFEASSPSAFGLMLKPLVLLVQARLDDK